MTTELAMRNGGGPLAPTAGVAHVADTIETLKAIRTFVANELKDGHDFGVIPGTGSKPTLYQPGAQKIIMYFNAYPSYHVQPLDLGAGHVEYIVTATVVHRGTNHTIGSGVGSCSTMESKYRFRKAERVCPQCGKAAIIKGKAEFGGGWLCFKKKDGCGLKFHDGDPAIESQESGQAENANIHDQRNTVLKMAKKRAVVDAASSLGCVSDLFTQDLEDRYDLNEQFVPVDTALPPEPKAPPKPSATFAEWCVTTAKYIGCDPGHLRTTCFAWCVENGKTTNELPESERNDCLEAVFADNRNAFRDVANRTRKMLQGGA